MSRVLLYDLEVSPNLGWTYDLWDTNVIRIERFQHLLSIGWKWLDEEEVSVSTLNDFPYYKKDKYDDRLLVETLWELFDAADVTVAHNGNRFDKKVATERFIVHGLNPPSPYRTIDTYLVAKKLFNTKYNSLDRLCKRFGIGCKSGQTHADLWYRCLIDGDQEAWDLMADYNANDVQMLEALYYKLRPYISNHPSLVNGWACPTCGSTNVQRRGYASTNAAHYQRYFCNHCGAWSKERTMDKTVGKPMLASI